MKTRWPKFKDTADTPGVSVKEHITSTLKLISSAVAFLGAAYIVGILLFP